MLFIGNKQNICINNCMRARFHAPASCNLRR
jgi:hypothetical protein